MSGRALSELARGLVPSGTIRVAALARALREQGRDVVDFSVGEPDFPTPLAAREAGKRAIDQRRTGYTANEGTIELRRAIGGTLERDHEVRYPPDQILVSPGAKASLFLAMLVLLDEGDEAIVPAPYWVSYPEQVRMARATPVFVETREEDGFRLRPDALRRVVTPSTRMVVLNYPANPTGATYDFDELAALAEVAVEHDLWILADEIYEKLTFDGRRPRSVVSLSEAVRERTVLINGLSKAYAMTGWRIGYAAGPREVIRAMSGIQSHDTGNATSISQWAGVEALTACEDDVRSMVAAFESRRDLVVAGLREIPGVTCVRPDGAFYAFPNVTACLGRRSEGRRIESSEDLAVHLLEHEAVAVVPGEPFGAPGFVRISFAASEERVREGLSRIRRALVALEPSSG